MTLNTQGSLSKSTAPLLKAAPKVFIAANVLARAIDVVTVRIVINYTIPLDRAGYLDPQTYLNRTGRFARVGVSNSFVHDQKSWMELRHIQRYFGVARTEVTTRDVGINSIRDGAAEPVAMRRKLDTPISSGAQHSASDLLMSSAL